MVKEDKQEVKEHERRKRVDEERKGRREKREKETFIHTNDPSDIHVC